MALCVTQGRPTNFSFTTYAIGSYQYGWQHSLNWSTMIADSLRRSVQKNIASFNISYMRRHFGASPTTVSLNSFENSGVVSNNFISSEAANYNFIFYYGHGTTDTLTMWNYSGYVTNNHVGVGVRDTYWALLHACLVFRNGHSSQDPWFDGVFKGAHSILGYSSSTFGSSHVIKAYKNFLNRWIVLDEKIWNAYSTAVVNIMHTEGGLDVEPKIVYRYGHVNNDFFDPWEEKFANAYNGPLFSNNDYDGIGSRWISLGTPIYGD